jgi:hypothetical protein
MFEGPLEPEEDGPLGWKGRAIDDSFGLVVLVVDDPAVEVKVLLDPAVVLSSVSVFSVSSSTGIVALGSIGNLRSRQSLTRSVILLKIDTLPSAVSWYNLKAALCSSSVCCSVAIRLLHQASFCFHRMKRLTRPILACSFPSQSPSQRLHHI